MTPPPPLRRRPGPVARLDQPERLRTYITSSHRRRLEDYCDRHRISMAEAVRQAIDLLVPETS